MAQSGVPARPSRRDPASGDPLGLPCRRCVGTGGRAHGARGVDGQAHALGATAPSIRSGARSENHARRTPGPTPPSRGTLDVRLDSCTHRASARTVVPIGSQPTRTRRQPSGHRPQNLHHDLPRRPSLAARAPIHAPGPHRHRCRSRRRTGLRPRSGWAPARPDASRSTTPGQDAESNSRSYSRPRSRPTGNLVRTVPVIICVSRSRFWQASPGDHRHAAHWCRAVGGSWSQRSSAVRWPARLRDSSAHAHEDIRSKNRVWAFAGRVRRSYRVAPTRVAGVQSTGLQSCPRLPAVNGSQGPRGRLIRGTGPLGRRAVVLVIVFAWASSLCLREYVLDRELLRE